MGMSASQVRFLSLQNRKHSITNQLSTLSNRKLALSRDMNAVSRKYTNALNQINLKWSNNCGVDTTVLSYDLMMKPNDINTEMPYMISDHHGRVVVDDEKIWFDKENCRLLRGSEIAAAGFVDENGNSLGMSYKEVAELISTYSGLGSEDNVVFETGADGRIIIGQGSFTNTNNTGIDSNTGYPIGGKAMVKDAWKIMNGIEDFDFSNNLRYLVFEKMGLIGAADKAHFNELLTELYGSQEAKEAGYNIKTNSNIGIIPASETDNIFGQLQGDFTLNGGCAMGNLSLAKKYLEEYEIYMNTPLKMSLNNDSGIDLNSRSYDSIVDSNQGVTNRLMDILNNKSTAVVDGMQADYVSDSVYGAGMTAMTLFGSMPIFQVDYEGSKTKDVGCALRTADGSAVSANSEYDCSWKDAYDQNYFVILSSIHAPGNDEQQCCSIAALNNVVRGFENSVISASYMGVSIDTEAAEYARYMTVAKFANNVDLIVNKSNSSKNGTYETIKKNIDAAIAHDNNIQPTGRNALGMARNGSVHSEYYGRAGEGGDGIGRAILNADNTNGVGSYRNTGPDNNQYVVSVRSLVNTYLTFYNAYVESNGEPSVAWRYGDNVVADGFSVNEEMPGANGAITSYLMGGSVTSETTTEGAYTYLDTDSDGFDDNTGMSNDLFNKIKTSSNKGEALYNELTDEQKTELKNLGYIDNIPPSDYSDLNLVASKLHKSTKTVKNSYELGNGVKANEIIESVGDVRVYRRVDFTGHPVYSSYIENYDENGVLQSHILNTKNSSGERWIDYNDDNDGDDKQIAHIKWEEHNGGNGNSSNKCHSHDILICEIVTGSGDYHIGKYSSGDEHLGSIYTDYLMIKPQDNAGIGDKLRALVDFWQQKVDQLLDELTNAFSGMEGKFMQYFDALFERVAENGWTYDSKVEKGRNPNAANYLDAMLQNNMYMVTEARELNSAGKFQYTTLIAQNVKKIYQVHDSNAENVAFSEYEADKSAIQSKEKVIDARMQRLETEQEAINTEMESIKKVRNENIEKTFKIFA